MAGMRVFNTSGTQQVNEEFSAYSLISKGTVTLSPDGATHPQPMLVGNVGGGGGYSKLAIAPPLPVNVAGNNGSWLLRCQNNTAITVPYWIFGTGTGGVGIGGPGLYIYRADGSLAFSSGMRTMRPVGFMFGGQLNPAVADASSWQAQGFPAGRTYAVIQASTYYRNGRWYSDMETGEAPIGTPKYYVEGSWYAACQVSGTTVYAGSSQFESYSNYYAQNEPAYTSKQEGQPAHVVIDVTGF